MTAIHPAPLLAELQDAMTEDGVTTILVDLFVLFAAAKIVGELFEALRQPQVVGELLAGVLIGPHVLGLVGDEGTIVLEVIAELGVIILLFTVGLETSARDLRQVGRPALLVGIMGVALPFLAGGGLMAGLGYQREEILFVAAALVATSVGITARVLRDLGAVRLPPSRIVLGAAVVDDILALLVLAVVAGLAGGPFSALGLVVLLVEVAVFLGVVVAFGPRVVRWLSRLAHTPLIPRSPLVFAVLLTLGLAALSGTIGLASLIGAFLAGMIFDFSRKEVATQIEPVYELLVPLFFAITGTRLDPTVFVEPRLLGLAAVITLIAVAAKVAGGYLGAVGLAHSGRLAVGVGMVPRGEVGLVVASVGLGLGVISRDLFGVVVAMTVVTTLATPPVLGPVIRREKKRLREAREHRLATGAAPSQGGEI
jgi:Kef-type K+ transport system membrane component KefB